MELATIIVFGVLTVLCACGVVFSRKTLHSALWLVATLFLIAVHFALLGAQFIAALQILIYAGAVMVLVVFVILLLGIGVDAEKTELGLSSYLAAVLCGVFIGALVHAVSSEAVFTLAQGESSAAIIGDAQAVGRLLITKYVYPFELSALLLLAAIIGAVLLADQPKRPLAAGRGLQAMRSDLEDEALTGKG